MKFQIDTPQTVGARLEMQKSKRAYKRKYAHGSGMEPSSKKQKTVPSSQPLAPSQPPAGAPKSLGLAPEVPKLADASQSLAETQSNNSTDLAPLTRKRKADHHSDTPFQGLKLATQESEVIHGSFSPVHDSVPAQDHDITNPEPVTKKQKLSYANLPPARVRKRISSEEAHRYDVQFAQIRLQSMCRRNGFDYQILSKLPHEILSSPNFTLSFMQRYMLDRGGLDFSNFLRAPKPSVFSLDESSTEESRAELPELDTHHFSHQDLCGHSSCSPAPSTVNLNSSDRGMQHESRDPRSDEVSPLSSSSITNHHTTQASSPQNPSVVPAPNQGGRPKSRKRRVYKPVKGPMRFQKNRPVDEAVNFDVWENILSFCPPAFLLKARTISSTFRSVLKDDSFLWKLSRTEHFGSDMPEPPLNLSEPQYADLLTGIGCQTRGCQAPKTRKVYWVFQKRLCDKCLKAAFLPLRAVKRVLKDLRTSDTPQYRSIARYYQNMEEFLPGMKFDRRDNYQWLGTYHPTPSWGKIYGSGQYVAFPASAYANFSSELAVLVGNEFDVEQGKFCSQEPMPGKTCPPQDAIDAWFDAKRAANETLVPLLQKVEDWHECYKRNKQKALRDIMEGRKNFYIEQAELAGIDASGLGDWNLEDMPAFEAAIAIPKPATMLSWTILQPKLVAEVELMKEHEADKKRDKKGDEEKVLDERELEEGLQREWAAEDWSEHDRILSNPCPAPNMMIE